MEATEILCPECGQLIKVRDIESFLLALHLANDCPDVPTLIHERNTA